MLSSDTTNGDASALPPSHQKATELIVKLRAAEVALVNIRQSLRNARSQDSFGHDRRELVKSELDFGILKNTLQRSLISMVEETMETSEKLTLLFSLIDSDQNKKLAELELANVFQLIRQGGLGSDNPQDQDVNQKPFSQAVEAAHLAIVAHDSTGDGYLDFGDFVSFLESMSTYLEDKSVNEIAETLIMDITTFCDEEQIVRECTKRFEAVKERKSSSHDNNTANFHKRLRTKFKIHEEARLFLLFQLIDTINGEEDNCAFKEVIEAMSPFSKLMDKEFRKMLFFVEEDPERFNKRIDFPEFIEFFENAVKSCPINFTVDRIVNDMTAHLCQEFIRGGGSSKGRATYDDIIDKALSSQASSIGQEREISDRDSSNFQVQVDKQRIHHLFNLWDTDKDESLDVYELFLGLRQFLKSRDLDEAMSDVLKAVDLAHTKCIDKDARPGMCTSNAGIDLYQFEDIIIDFGAEVGVEVDELVDFMYLETVTKRNHAEESDPKEYQFIVKHKREKQQEEKKFRNSELRLPSLDDIKLQNFIPALIGQASTPSTTKNENKNATSNKKIIGEPTNSKRLGDLPSSNHGFKGEDDDNETSIIGNASGISSTDTIDSKTSCDNSGPIKKGEKESALSQFIRNLNLAQEEVDTNAHS